MKTYAAVITTYAFMLTAFVAGYANGNIQTSRYGFEKVVLRDAPAEQGISQADRDAFTQLIADGGR